MNTLRRIALSLARIVAGEPANATERALDRTLGIVFDSRTELWEFASAAFASGLGVWLILFPDVQTSILHEEIRVSFAFFAAYGIPPHVAAGTICLALGVNGLAALFADKLNRLRTWASVALAALWTTVFYTIGPLAEIRHPFVPIFFTAAVLSALTGFRLSHARQRARAKGYIGLASNPLPAVHEHTGPAAPAS